MPHSPLDIYAQYRFLDPGIFGTSFTRFRNKYAIMGGYENHQVLGYQNEEDLSERFYRIAYKVSSDVLDLPEVVEMERFCALSPYAQRVYQQMEDEFYTQVEDGEVTAANALVKLLRLQQIVSGYIKTDTGNIERIDTAKNDLLLETLSDIDPEEPITVFCRFVEDLKAVREAADALDRPYGELSGAQDDLVDAEYPEWAKVLGVQIQAGSEGIDLTRSRYCLYYSTGFSLGTYLQSRKRVHRPGQERETIYIHLTAKNTIDEKVAAALQKRQDVINSILDYE